MLVKFQSSTAGNMILFAEPATALLQCIGKECTARGVITEEQLPAAIAALETLLQRETLPPAERDKATDDKGNPMPVDLARRAVPLLNLLRHTQEEKGYVVWEAPQDFGPRPG